MPFFRLLVLVAPLLLVSAPPTDAVFSGGLESVGTSSIAIRLPDRRVICARLPEDSALNGKALAAKYRMGDQVEVSCKTIEPLWEKSTARYQYLEVTAIRLIEHPSAEKLATALTGMPFHEGENLLERPRLPLASAGDGLSGPGSSEFELARKTNLEYLSHMPNFVADEMVKRYRSTAASPQWTKLDTLQTEVTVQGDRTVRRQIRRDGKPWDQPYESLPGFKWYGGFGSEIRPLFDPQCPATLHYEGHSEYKYETPVDGCFSFFYQKYQRYNPPRSGSLRIDAAGDVVQIDEEARGFPTEFELSEREEHITWDNVKIGDEAHWVPVRANCLAAYYSGTKYRIEVEFKNHRHFEASTNVTFH
jgi:hypothetical protein